MARSPEELAALARQVDREMTAADPLLGDELAEEAPTPMASVPQPPAVPSGVDPDDALALARQLAAELRHLRGRWLRRQLNDESDPFGGALGRADALAAKLEDVGTGVAGPTWAVFGARLAVTGDPTLAAAAVGRAKAWGRRQVAQHPEILRAALGDDRAAPKDWGELHDEARGTVARVMRHGEHKDALKAAETVIERVEGRSPLRIQDDSELAGALLETVFFRYVTALHLVAGLELGEAERRAREDPEAVQAWGRKRGLLPGGKGGGGAADPAEIVQEAPAAPLEDAAVAGGEDL